MEKIKRQDLFNKLLTIPNDIGIIAVNSKTGAKGNALEVLEMYGEDDDIFIVYDGKEQSKIENENSKLKELFRNGIEYGYINFPKGDKTIIDTINGIINHH